MTVFAYCRVSTLRQANEGLSLEVQEQQIANYAKLHGLSVDVWLKDAGVSGSTELVERDAGSQLLQAKSGDVIISAKLDRMFRNANHALNSLEDFKARGISLVFIDLGGDVSNGIGQMIFVILSAVADQERNRIRERVSEVKAKLRSESRYSGGAVAFGFRLENDKLVKDEAQQHCLRMVQRKRNEGYSFRELSSYVSSEFGMKLSHNAIRNILRGERKFGSVIENC